LYLLTNIFSFQCFVVDITIFPCVFVPFLLDIKHQSIP
jgi:hypothetical protein